MLDQVSKLLEVQTGGESGIRYRHCSTHFSVSPIAEVKDTYDPPTTKERLTSHFSVRFICRPHTTGRGNASMKMSVQMLMHDIASANFPNPMQCPDAVVSHILRSGMHCNRHTRTEAIVIAVRNATEPLLREDSAIQV
jgi:hypothetical protein